MKVKYGIIRTIGLIRESNMALKDRPRQSRVVTLMPTTWDAGATGMANRAGLIEEPAVEFDASTGRRTENPNMVRRHRRKTMIEIYASGTRPWLSHSQAAAAERLYRAAMGNPDRDPLCAIGDVRGGGGDPQAAAVDRRREFQRMWRCIPRSSWPVVERVVIDDLPIWSGVHRQHHMQRLCIGLDAIP